MAGLGLERCVVELRVPIKIGSLNSSEIGKVVV